MFAIPFASFRRNTQKIKFDLPLTNSNILYMILTELLSLSIQTNSEYLDTLGVIWGNIDIQMNSTAGTEDK